MVWLAVIIGLLAVALIGWAGWRQFRRELDGREAEICALKQRLANTAEAHRISTAESESRQQAVFDSMTEGVLLLDSQGKVVYTNSACRRFFGLPGDATGKTLLEAFRHLELNRMAEELIAGQDFIELELQINGESARWLQVNGTVRRDSSDKLAAVLMILHDTTRVRELEHTRREFVANVSHELRTPLSLIKGGVETLKSGAKDEPKTCAKFLDIIDRHTDRLIFLIEDLLTLSKLEGSQALLNFETVSISTVVNEVLGDLAPRAEARDVTLTNEVSAAILVRADFDRLQQVLYNLVDNAIKYGRIAGHVKVSAQRLSTTNWVEVAVEDDGPGIPPDAAARVFERFYRVDSARSREQGGTGLGLSIVKHIVQAHGGAVSLDSALGQGARFRFTLPAVVG
jgi:two-component system phosphate regulon sensor histidine kinase PhoR